MKVFSAGALLALQEALGKVFWFREDLRRFLVRVLSESSADVLSVQDWDGHKWRVAENVVTLLHTKGRVEELVRLADDLATLRSFPHLERLQDGKAKARSAQVAVEHLRTFLESVESARQDATDLKKRRVAAAEAVGAVQMRSSRLETLRIRFFSFVGTPQAKGFELERILYDAFALFDLDPKASFRTESEQVDGAFAFEGTDFLVEAKWQKVVSDIGELDSLRGKLGRRLDNTLGLFVSIAGFSEGATKPQTGRSTILLADGADLIAVLDQRIGLDELLKRKKRFAAQTGDIFLRAADILSKDQNPG